MSRPRSFGRLANRLLGGLGLELRRKSPPQSAFARFDQMIRGNRCEDFERMYADDEFLAVYLSADRLAFYRKLAQIAQSYRPSSLIDVGCGSGHFLLEVSRTFECRLSGSDITAAGCERARALLPQADVRQATFDTLPAVFSGQKFDLVCCLEVLEHLQEPEDALRTLRAVTADGGKLLLTVPDGRLDTWEGHINFWSATSFAVLLRRFGEFSVEQADGVLVAREL